jgi:hypothetical protein
VRACQSASGSLYPSTACATAFLALLVSAAAAASAYVRVNQAGYETANAPFQAYLMSTTSESGATFSVINSKGATVYSSAIGALLSRAHLCAR